MRGSLYIIPAYKPPLPQNYSSGSSIGLQEGLGCLLPQF